MASVFFTFALVGSAVCFIYQQADCHIMSVDSGMCQMSIVEHIDHWDQVFVSIVPGTFTLSMVGIIFLSLAFSFSAVSFPVLHYVIRFLGGHPDRGRNRRLHLALSRGIIQSLVYA